MRQISERLILRLLVILSDEDIALSIMDFLSDKYNEKRNRKSRFRAICSYNRHLIQIIFSLLIQKISWSITMFKHQFVQLFRNIKKDKLSFSINLISLSTGLTCVFLILLWVNGELNIDRFHENDSQLYSVLRNRVRPNGVIQTTQEAPSPLAKALKEEFPEVKNSVAVNYMTISRDGNRGVVYSDNRRFNVRGQFAGREYFNIFSYPLVHGDRSRVLTEKNSVVITETLARKLFRTDDVLGKTIKYKHQVFEGVFQITGVCKKPPVSSTVQFDLIFSYDVLLKHVPSANKWTGSYACTYLVLKKGTDTEQFNKKIRNFIELKHKRNKGRTLFIQKYSDSYLYGNFKDGVADGGRIFYVKLFSLIALFILIIACVNFISLATAKAAGRMKEVGIKKALGIARKSLVTQFFGESVMMTTISSLLAICSTLILLPFFNRITGTTISVGFGLSNILSVLGIVLLTGLLSGIYPAIYLSKFNPVTVLKGLNHRNSKADSLIRKGLVIFQFIISVSFIVIFFVVNRQIDFIQTKNTGYSSENIIVFERRGRAAEFKAFMAELKKVPGVINASSMNNNMLQVRNSSRLDSWEGKIPDGKTAIVPYPSINYDFIETMGIKLKEGRSFSRKQSSENTKVILNEAAVEMMGIKDPIGKTINIDRSDKQIIGVVKDFHFESLYKDIQPLAIKFSEYGSYVYIKLKAGEEKVTIDRIKKVYNKFQDFPFEFSFMNDTYQQLYESEKKLAGLVKYASVLTIIISCLGLFGLATFSSQKRFKEICIRKVLGASVWRATLLLSFEYTKMLLAALIVALPLSYIVVDTWLSQFANRITMDWWIFALSSAITLLLGWTTVGIQTVKLATVKPASGLKDE